MRITLEQEIWFSPKASKRLSSLKPVFKELLHVHQDYIDGERSLDCPYWYSERPHIGFLAAAVWRQNGTALEEFGTHKTRDRKRKRGRGDLYIRTRKTGFECEAKRLWLPLGNNAKKSCHKVNASLHKAVGDVRNLKIRKGLALCFVTPVINQAKTRELDTRRREWIKMLNQAPEYDALVWIGITKGQRLFGDKFKHFGLLLAVKEVR